MKARTDAAIRAGVEAALRQAEDDAWLNLSRGKYANFGYYAARTVVLRRILGRGRDPSPFRPLRDLALVSTVALTDPETDVPPEEAHQ